MWLPRPIYEAVPYATSGAGVAAFALAWYAERAPRGWLLFAGGLLVTAGLVIWMKRRDYRRTQAGYDPGAIDE